jgi:Asp-tRNA(Asn)/Glu-tRNA(Gln) amidotransferase A subunit family amidase
VTRPEVSDSPVVRAAQTSGQAAGNRTATSFVSNRSSFEVGGTGKAMAGIDILVSASQIAEAPRITEVPKWATLEKPSLTIPFNLTGCPAMSVCSGFGAGGLPVCVQLIAKPFAEPLLFKAAHAYETSVATRKRRPALAMQEAA